jgi:hypothetical protein
MKYYFYAVWHEQSNTVLGHYEMERPDVAGAGDGLQIWTVADLFMVIWRNFQWVLLYKVKL